jgi:Uncharacterised nucleotidyltransferase
VPTLPWGSEPGKRDVWPSVAQEKLLRAALVGDERALEAWREVRPLIDVARLDGATQALLPVLRKNLLALGVQDELLNLFKGVHRYSWARNQTLLAPMMPIVEALEQAGVATLLMKGAAFVADRRLDAGMRPMNDVDVLVPGEQLERAVEVLLVGGLVPVGGVPPWYVTGYAPRFVPSHGFRDELDRQLDLHWHVLHSSCQQDADEDFWTAARPIELLGVQTRALCPADELLLVILHGLRWNALPTYRWVVDAALLCGGEIGVIDYERLVEQARLRRVTAALRAGLEYLRRVIDTPIPDSCMRKLGSVRPSRLERMELRAQMTQPRRRTGLQWQVVYQQQHARRELALHVKPRLLSHLKIARARLGVKSLVDLRHVLSGGAPGPGRPDSEMAAAVGRGVGEASATPLGLGEWIDFADPESAHACCAYGMWRAEGEGSWIAGRQARLMLELAEPTSGSLVLEVSAEGFLPKGLERQRLGVGVNGVDVAEFVLRDKRSLRGESVVLPAEVLKGSRRLDIVLSAPDAASPARLGLADDDRSIGVYLRRLGVRAPMAYRVGETLALGSGACDEGALAGGWGVAEPTGRWSIGRTAALLLSLESGARTAELEFDAIPFLAAGRRAFQVEVLANGQVLGSVSYEGTEPAPRVSRLALPSKVAGEREILLEWRVRDPYSPAALGISTDRRELGVFMRRVVLSDRALAPAPGDIC